MNVSTQNKETNHSYSSPSNLQSSCCKVGGGHGCCCMEGRGEENQYCFRMLPSQSNLPEWTRISRVGLSAVLGYELPGNALPQNKLFSVISVFTWELPGNYGNFPPVTFFPPVSEPRLTVRLR